MAGTSFHDVRLEFSANALEQHFDDKLPMIKSPAYYH